MTFWNKFWLTTGILFVLSVLAAPLRAERFDDRMCAPLEAIAAGVAQHKAEGSTVSVESKPSGLTVTINNVTTVWQNMPGTLVWCMQEHLGGQGA